MLYAPLAAKLALSTIALASLLLYPAPIEGRDAEVKTVVAEEPKKEVEEKIVEEKKEEPINTNYGPGDCSKYEALIRSYDWPVDTALEICRKESGGNTNAINWTDVHKDRNGNVICVTSRGLMQIACVHVIGTEYTLEDLATPETNLAIAYKIWKNGGFHPWSTYKN